METAQENRQINVREVRLMIVLTVPVVPVQILQTASVSENVQPIALPRTVLVCRNIAKHMISVQEDVVVNRVLVDQVDALELDKD
jgi:hypothetical protein